jgi:hypothetical protein
LNPYGKEEGEVKKKRQYGFFGACVTAIVLNFMVFGSCFGAGGYEMLPTANITIDGNYLDWLGISSVVLDPTGDSTASLVDGTDMTSVSMALNSDLDTLYVRMDISGGPNVEECEECDDPDAGLIQYSIAFDDPDIFSYGTSVYDWQIGFDIEQFWIWDLRGQKDYNDISNLTIYNQNAAGIQVAVGTVVELAIPLSLLQNPFKTTARVYLELKEGDGEVTTTDTASQDVQFRTFPLFADAGPDESYYEKSRIVLDGGDSSISGDSDSIVSYQWKQTSGPEMYLMDSGQAQAWFAAPCLDGSGITVTFSLTVDSDEGLEDSDDVVLYIYDAGTDENYPDYWDEDDYLSANPDVAAAIGYFSSGYDHFMRYGKFEGRRGGITIHGYPSYWDEDAYLDDNQDVSSAVFTGYFKNGFEHYVLFGKTEGRLARVSSTLPDYWDEDGYLERHPDVASAVQSGWLSNGLEHYLNWGRYEGRMGGLNDRYPDYWDEHGYMSTNTDVAPVVRAGFFMTGFEHYLLYGEIEGRLGGF